ncbi:MAG: ubiquitin-like domain-containing protein [Lachnospiraceae bacterium]|nr:ubiquitin-like domain-containing protein [Lachnospiraceae bacterium]
MKNRMMKFFSLMIVMVAVLAALTGCKKSETATDSVKVEDGYVETIVKMDHDMSVEEVLKEAEITLGEKDEVTPALNETVKKDDTISIVRYANVTVKADKKEYQVNALGGRVKDALKEAGITLGKNDVVNHDEKAYLTEGMELSVTRMSQVTFVADGKTKNMLTEAETVKDFLADQNVKVGKDDRLSMKESDKLTDGSKLVLKRVTYKEKTVTESIPYSTSYRTNRSMNSGTSRVTRSGVNGQKKVKYRICYVDGKEESKKQISSSVIKNPQNRVIVRGTKPSKRIVKKWKEVECDGTVIWHIKYSDGTTKIYYR